MQNYAYKIKQKYVGDYSANLNFAEVDNDNSI